MSRKEDIESAYRSLGSEATFYDGMVHFVWRCSDGGTQYGSE